MEYKAGDVVIVRNSGKQYASHKEMAKILGLHNFIKEVMIKNGERCTVISIHENSTDMFYGVEDDSGVQYIIGSKGLELAKDCRNCEHFNGIGQWCSNSGQKHVSMNVNNYNPRECDAYKPRTIKEDRMKFKVSDMVELVKLGSCTNDFEIGKHYKILDTNTGDWNPIKIENNGSYVGVNNHGYVDEEHIKLAKDCRNCEEEKTCDTYKKLGKPEVTCVGYNIRTIKEDKLKFKKGDVVKVRYGRGNAHWFTEGKTFTIDRIEYERFVYPMGGEHYYNCDINEIELAKDCRNCEWFNGMDIECKDGTHRPRSRPEDPCCNYKPRTIKEDKLKDTITLKKLINELWGSGANGLEFIEWFMDNFGGIYDICLNDESGKFSFNFSMNTKKLYELLKRAGKNSRAEWLKNEGYEVDEVKPETKLDKECDYALEKQLSLIAWDWRVNNWDYDKEDSDNTNRLLEAIPALSDLNSHCPYCQKYSTGEHARPDCTQCPLYKHEGLNCYRGDSTYAKWNHNQTPETTKAMRDLIARS